MLVSVTYMSPFFISLLKRRDGQRRVHVNYLNINFYRQLARAALWPPLAQMFVNSNVAYV